MDRTTFLAEIERALQTTQVTIDNLLALDSKVMGTIERIEWAETVDHLGHARDNLTSILGA